MVYILVNGILGKEFFNSNIYSNIYVLFNAKEMYLLIFTTFFISI